MSFSVRNAKFDLLLVAGPRVANWPSVGVTTLSRICSQSGLRVGFFGGEHLKPRGVVPLPGAGGLLIVEDAQNRIHRIEGRAIVRWLPSSEMSDPFPGWRSPGLVPISTAQRLRNESVIRWAPTTAILGTGNKALRFGSSLLESGVPRVYAVESMANWGGKRYAAWEVERRRFEMAGGKIIEAKPLSLTPKSAMVWELRLEDSQGVRLLDVQRVVAAGPFSDFGGMREYPTGSGLFDIEQTALPERSQDIEGWLWEEERSRLLAARITRLLSADLGEHKEEVERVYRRARARLKRFSRSREVPFSPAYEGKWIHPVDAKKIRTFSGTPKVELEKRLVASIECFEDIGCDLCARACPESAIDFSGSRESVLREDKCTACGICLDVCPSAAPLLMKLPAESPTARITLSWRGRRGWTVNELATLLNRRGETLGSGRVVEVKPAEASDGLRVELEVAAHLAWEVRGIRRGRPGPADLEADNSPLEDERMADRVEVSLNGEKRLLREKIPASIALFETGLARSEDVLLCADGSCGLCEITVDGVKKLACQIPVHRGMAILTTDGSPHAQAERDAMAADPAAAARALCPCLGITSEQVLERVEQGRLSSPEAVVEVTRVGEGRCHGQLCGEPLRRLLTANGVQADAWVDRRFPWTEWVLVPGKLEP